MSWSDQNNQQQRYTPVPGFGGGGGNGGLPRGGAQYPLEDVDEKERYELGDMYDTSANSLPPAHRAVYSDPFNDGSSPSIDSDRMYPAGNDGGIASTSSLPGRQRQPSWSRSSYSAAGAGGAAAAGGAVAGYSAASMARQNIPADQLWAMDAPGGAASGGAGNYDAAAKTGMSKKKKTGIIVGIVLGALIIIAVVVAVVVTQVNKSKSSSSSSNDTANSSTSSSSSNSSTVLSDPNDPSNFTLDARLHNVFWGIAYEPDGVILPDCGAVQANVTRDIQLLSQLTTRLHLYGANCNETALVMQAIQDTKVNMTIWLAIYVDSDTQAFTDQVAAVSSALTTYGVDMVEGIAVGNEYILDAVGSLTSGSAYDEAVEYLATQIQTVNTTIAALNLSKSLPIGTADAGSVMSTTLAESVDFFMANVHPWFGSLAIDDAAVWTWEYFNENDVDVAQEAPNKPASYIAETGWPTQSMNASEADDGAGSPQGDASDANLQTFLDTFVCQANANGTQYFYFEAFDEAWKEIYGGVEPYWGLFDKNRVLKNITIPTCS